MSTPLSVLMIEDSEDSCFVMAAELERHGYQPTWRRVDTAEGLRSALTEQRWDVLIADYVVPGFDALKSLDLVRELGAELPIIVVSGNCGEDVAVAVMKAGAHDFVTKGNLSRLVPAIERELREAQARQARRQAEEALLKQRQRAEEALRQSEARFRGVVENLGEGLLLTDLEDRVLYANSRLAELAGRDPSALVGKPIDDVLRVCSGAGASSARASAVEQELLCEQGGTIWVEVKVAPLRDSKGQVTGTIRAVTDITERRRAREALRKSQASLLLAQRIGHVGSWELDLASRSMEWSAETRRILDLDPEGATPTLDRFLRLLHEQDRNQIRQAIEKAIQEGSSCQADARVVRLDGEERFVHFQAQVILDSAEKPIRLLGTVQDLTERRHLEEQLRHSQKMEAVGQLAGGIAHDFNNILTIIQGYAELLSHQPNLDAHARSYAGQITVSADRASKLTRQLLAFSRKQVMQLRNLQINDLLQNLSAMLQRLLGEQIQLHLHLQPDLPLANADSGMMEQVLVNLVVNARDAMPKGGRLMIETAVHQIDPEFCRVHSEASPGTFISLNVTDTGTGMTPETLSHVFEPFFTTKEVGRGTGLGLSTAYGIVRQHRGWIQVASELGRGSSFKLFLPAVSPAPGAVLPPLQGAGGVVGSETILLAEDEPLLRELARSVLEKQGYQVFEAGSGPEALEVWKQMSKIDLLLTDMVMPGGMTGRDLALRLQAEKPSLKVLYTSGYSLDFVESDLLLREGLNFVPKPYNGTTLCQGVRACLDRPR